MEQNQQNRLIDTDLGIYLHLSIQNKICYKLLAHMIRKAEKFHNMPSASWRPRKAGGVIQSEPEGLRIMGANGISPGSKAGEGQSGF